jgi:hypothetical protein
MRLFVAVVLGAFAASAFAQSPSFQIHGFLTTREVYVKAPPSWSVGGFGRFDVGADKVGDHRIVNLEVAQLGLDWKPSGWLLIHADGVARHEQAGTRGRRAGLLQGYADMYNQHWRLRAGAFWLPTSRENVDPLWTSRYTITYSALNSWIGDEVRPWGADLQYSPNFYLTAGATAFRGNDTMGTALAARGWTFGSRLTAYNEEIALPPPDTTFKPIGRDLDGKNGYAERIRVQLPERALLQVTHIENRAPLVPDLHGQTPWRTRFNVVGAEVGTSGPTTLAGEWASGSTGIGFPGGSYTMDFSTTYVLLSHKRGADRWTVRVERFSTRDHAHSVGDDSREQGHAVTLAWLRDAGEHLRVGLEYANVKGDRPGAATVGFDPRTGGSTISIEARYSY